MTHPEVRETLSDVRDALPEVWERSGCPSGGPGEVGRPFRCFGRGREANQEFQEVSEGPTGGLGGVKRPSRLSGRGMEAHAEVQKGS